MGACSALARYCWLVPFAHAIAVRGVPAKPGELARALGTRSAVARAALRGLRLAGLLRGGELDRSVVECLEGLRVSGRRYVWRHGSNYFLIVVKRTRVACYTVPAPIVESASSIGVRDVKALAQALGVPPIVASRALRVIQVLESQT